VLSLLTLLEDIKESGVTAPHFLDLGSQPHALNRLTQNKSPRYSSDRMSAGPDLEAVEKKKFIAPAGNRRPILCFPGHSIHTIAVYISAQFLAARGKHFTFPEFPQLPLRKLLL